MGRYLEDHGASELFVSGSLESLVPEHSLARLVWQALSGLDFSGFDALYKNDSVGRCAVDPRRLAGVWILALVRGESSSVRVAQWCARDVEFRWMLGDAPVHKSTLCDFRRNRTAELAQLSTQVLAGLGRCGLLPGAALGVDGTMIRAASSCRATRTRKQLARQVDRLRVLVERKLLEPETAQDGVPELEARIGRLQAALEEMESLGLDEKTAVTISEPDARLRRQKDDAFAPGYNVQAVTDLDTGVIVHAQVIAQGNDAAQLQPQIEQAEAALRAAKGASQVQAAAADAAYHDVRQLAALEERGIRCAVPERGVSTPRGVAEGFKAEAFRHDEAADTLVCPAEKTLKRRKLNDDKTSVVYQAAAADCAACPHKSQCCPNAKTGRSVNRTLYRGVIDTAAQRVASEDGKALKRARWTAAEGAFARLNGQLGMRRCRMWNQAGAQAEVLWRQLAHNLMLLCRAWKPLACAKATPA